MHISLFIWQDKVSLKAYIRLSYVPVPHFKHLSHFKTLYSVSAWEVVKVSTLFYSTPLTFTTAEGSTRWLKSSSAFSRLYSLCIVRLSSSGSSDATKDAPTSHAESYFLRRENRLSAKKRAEEERANNDYKKVKKKDFWKKRFHLYISFILVSPRCMKKHWQQIKDSNPGWK